MSKRPVTGSSLLRAHAAHWLRAATRAGRASALRGGARLRYICFCLALLCVAFIGCRKEGAPQVAQSSTAAKDNMDSGKGRASYRRKPLRRSLRSRKSRRSSHSQEAAPAAQAPTPTVASAPPARMAPGAVTGGSGGDLPTPMAKTKGKKKKATKAQVWQRSKANTVLSKVSVGGKQYLILKKMRVTVSVEGLRARTVIDHIYYNPFDRQLQGTFKYTLPAQASVSYYAMFIGREGRQNPRFFGPKMTLAAQQRLAGLAPQLMVRRAPKPDWGKLREARLVGAEKGREVYEEITRRRIDPALLEQDAPNTFTGRVFPIPARGYNRVIIAYEQTLPQLGDELVYRFRFPDQVADSIDLSISYDDTLTRLTRSNLRRIRCKANEAAALLRCYWEQNKPDRDAVLYFRPKHKHVNWVAGTDPVENKRYLYARARVQLPTGPSSFSAAHGIFALDTSLSANPDLFAAHVALMAEILERNQARMPYFNVLLFDVNAQWMQAKGWLSNTPAARSKLLAKINRIVLEGATNLEAALQALAHPSWSVKRGTPVDIFVLSDGQVNWGETRLDGALGRFHKEKPFGTTRIFTYQMGIGSENATLQQRLVREGGAQFSCLGRAEIPRCAVAHTRPSMLLEEVQIKGIGASEILVEGRQVSLYPGALLAIASRFRTNGPATIVLRGQYLGKPISVTHKIKVKADGELAPRAWAELTVAQLGELDSDQLTPLIVAYSQHFRIPNQHCSMLILETDREYKAYGLDTLRKAERVTDIAEFMIAWEKRFGRSQGARKRWWGIIQKGMKRANINRGSTKQAVSRLFSQVDDASFALSQPYQSRLWHKQDVPAAYLDKRLQDQNEFGPFVREARRRITEDIGGAIRALSSIVELHPGNPQGLRLVGYYLMAWNRPAEAAQIFLRVLERRSFEPHSYRDLARALVKLERYGLAAVLYEIASAGQWHRRFLSINTVLREEYAMLAHLARKSKSASRRIKRSIGQRTALLGLRVKRSKLRVTVTWNTDNTDVDLWVDEPNGQRCFYRNRRTDNGGALLQDVTQGYGPERYENIGGRKGAYRIRLDFFGHRSNVLGNETHVSVVIVKYAGTARQEIIEKNFVLKRRKQKVNVARLSL